MKKDSEVLFKDFDFGKVCFVIDKTLENYVHPCNISDIEILLRNLPQKDLEGISFIVFDQPTRKAEAESPRWASYYPEYSRGKVSGSAIFLEAVNLSKRAKWKTSLTPDDQRELKHLQEEGHEIDVEKNFIFISMDLKSTRKTQLERSFIHELGHHVDFKRNPSVFHEKSKNDKESFANQYAQRIKKNFDNVH